MTRGGAQPVEQDRSAVSDQSTNKKTSSKLLAYLQLFRLPNVFTALADVSMGYLFVRSGMSSPASFALLLAATSLMYTAGMVLNDVFDLEQDRLERPWRPLPSGRIAVGWARTLGGGMLLGGVLCALLAGAVYRDGPPAIGRAGAIALLLASCVLLYDGLLKATPVGPLMMGLCRSFNVLLGMSFMPPGQQPGLLSGFGIEHLLVAGGIGTYIAGVTWFARSEARASSRWQLSLALLVMVGGVVMLALFPRYATGRALMLPSHSHWWLLLALLGFTIVRRCLMAIVSPRPAEVQLAVKHSILSLIMLDAAVTLEVGSPYWALGIAMLLAPTLLLGRWVYST